jgi:hypothetical protein
MMNTRNQESTQAARGNDMSPVVISTIIAAASFILTIYSAIYLNQRHVDKLVEQLEKRFEARITGTEGLITGLAQTMEARIAGLAQTTEARIAGLEQTMNARFDAVNERFEKMEQIMNARFEKLEQIMNARFHAVESRLDRIEQIAF